MDGGASNRETSFNREEHHMTFRDRAAASQVLGVVLILGFLAVEPFSGRTFAEELNGVRLLEEMQNVFINLADRVKPAVVNISPVSVSAKSGESLRERGPNNPGTGSGVIVDKDGTVVTNNHVVGDAKEVEVRLSDKSKYVGQVIGRDPDTDLAVVKVTADRALPTVAFGDSSKVRVGQWVMAVGNPFSLDRTVTVGVVSGLERDAVPLSRYEAFLQTDASLKPGDIIAKVDGRRVETPAALSRGVAGLAPGTKVELEIIRNGERRALTVDLGERKEETIVASIPSPPPQPEVKLGLNVQDLTPDLADKFKIKDQKGVLVSKVDPGSVAQEQGLREGDLIKEVNRQLVTSAEEFKTALAQTKTGDSVLLRVVRENRAFYSVLSPREK